MHNEKFFIKISSKLTVQCSLDFREIKTPLYNHHDDTPRSFTFLIGINEQVSQKVGVSTYLP